MIIRLGFETLLSGILVDRFIGLIVLTWDIRNVISSLHYLYVQGKIVHTLACSH
jgi:hypothetical protein